ncbi:hypothetical protein ACFX58_10125 [Sphingomonas sp. NCPPB 2930]
MAISEKTVELNISRTVIEKMRRYHQIKAYALGATQAQESMFGFDIEITDGAWSGGFVQYKRLHHVAGGFKRWNLNRTTHRDQHSLLLWIEATGIPVFYCLPNFDSEIELRRWTPPPLWTQAWWIKPSDIPVPPPIDKYHHLTLSPAGIWKVHSDEGKAFDPGLASFKSLEENWFDRLDKDIDLATIKTKLNKEIYRRWELINSDRLSSQSKSEKIERAEHGRYMGNILQGLGLISYSRE